MRPGRVELARTRTVMSWIVGMSSRPQVTVVPAVASSAWMRRAAGLAQKVSQSKGMKPSSMQPW